MDYLFFINTPAQVHKYRNVASELIERDHNVKILARDVTCTLDLLEYYNLPYKSYGKVNKSQRSLLFQAPRHYTNIARFTRKTNPDLIFGAGVGPYSGPAGILSRAPVVTLCEVAPRVGLQEKLFKPLTDAIISPNSIGKRLTPNHYGFDGHSANAYLHPELFTYDQSVFEDLGIERSNPTVLLRFNSFGSNHDIGMSGFDTSERRQLISKLSEYCTVIVSDEGNASNLGRDYDNHFIEYNAHPAKFHDFLAGINLVISDGHTIPVESCLLGTPTIRSNSYVDGKEKAYIKDLEDHGLIHNFKEFDAVLKAALDVINDSSAIQQWERKRMKYMKSKPNLTEIMVSVAEAPYDLENLEQITALHPIHRNTNSS